jgi:hypothetical protein
MDTHTLIQRSAKTQQLYLKILAGVIFTDKEALAADYIVRYIEYSCKAVGEIVNGSNTLLAMVKNGIIKPGGTYDEVIYYTHNLPRTIQANFPTKLNCKKCNDAQIPNNR